MTDYHARLTSALADRYRLVRELGSGGMATVWLAHDLRHERQVAIKVLHPELSAVLGPDRFLAEIRLTAGLQHPHILPLFDSGVADGLLFYVMPFVEGETLRGRLDREHQLPVGEAVRLAAEVADALAHAHARGIVHRDIKPENLLLQGGHALVADFGIALAVTQAGGARMTQTGLSLGTPQYMAPEQAMGERDLTPRCDVYAVGCVLHEMLAGEPPFTGPNAQAIVARVLTEVPRPLRALRPSVPPHVEAVVATALAKLPADRFADARAFADALGDAAYAGTGAQRATGVAAPAAGRPRLALPLVALAAVLLAVIAAGSAFLRRAPEAPERRFLLAFPAGQAPIPSLGFALTPDGSALIYRALSPTGTLVLMRKPRDSWAATPIPGTEGATFAGASPDGSWIAFAQQGALRKTPAGGGPAITLVESRVATGGTWLDDGTLLYVGTDFRLWRIPADGGTPTVTVDDTSYRFLRAEGLPGSRGALVVRCGRPCVDAWEVASLDLRTGAMRTLFPGAVAGFPVPTGHVALVRLDGALLVAPFDDRTLAVTGPASLLRDSVAVFEGRNAHIAHAADGTLLVRTAAAGMAAPTFRMVWLDREGRETPVDTAWTFRHAQFGGNAGWSLSPDGTRLAIGLRTNAGDDVWVKQLPRGPLTRVTFDSAPDVRPRWLPDGRHLMFSSMRETRGLYRRAADGTGLDSLLLPGDYYEGVLSADGAWLVARGGGVLSSIGGRDIGAVRLGVDSALRPLVATRFDESEVALSPDGRWLAYVSDESGRPEVYVRPFPDVDRARWQLSSEGGVSPVWARDGRELFFIGAARALMVVPVAPGGAFAAGEPRGLFRLPDDVFASDRQYYPMFDAAPDGRRFLVARQVRATVESGPAPIQVTLNWHAELRRRFGGR